MKYLESYKLLEKKVPSSERHNIYRDDKYILVSPLTHNASCKYGAFSDWCISVPGEDYMWDMSSPENRKTIVIILIQRNLEYSKEREDKIRKYKKYNLKVEYGEELTESERDEMLEMEDDGSFLDLRKVAFIYDKKNNKLEVWTNNNLPLDDIYSNPDFIYDLPLDSYIIDEVFKYIDNYENLSEMKENIKTTFVEFVLENKNIDNRYKAVIKKDWTNKYYRIEIPNIGFEDAKELDSNHLSKDSIEYGKQRDNRTYSEDVEKYANDVSLTDYDYKTNIANFSGSSMEDVNNWLEFYKDRVYTDFE